MNLRALALLTALVVAPGCSLILDPDNCSSDGDCLEGGVCKDGVCVGGVEPSSGGADGGGGGVTPDAAGGSTVPDGHLPDASPPDGPVTPPDLGHDQGLPDVGGPADMGDAAAPDVPHGVLSPLCAILAPDDANEGLVVPSASYSVTVQVTDGDTAPADLIVSVGGQDVALDAQGTATLDVALAEGANEIVLEGRDVEAHRCMARRTIVRDTAGPGIELRTENGDPAGNQLQVATAPLAISVHLTEPHGIGTVTATQNDLPVREIAPPADPAGDYVVTFRPSPGSNRMAVTATDSVGNSSTADLQVYFDGEAPELQLTFPADRAVVEVQTINVRGTATDNLGAAGVSLQLRVEAQGHNPFTAPVRRPDDVDGNFQFPDVPLFNGANTITVTAADAIQETVRTVTVNVQAGAPSVDFTEPAPAAVVAVADPDVHVAGTASPSVDEVEVGLPGNYQTIVPQDGTWEAVIHLPAEGQFTLDAIGRTPGGRASATAHAAVIFDSSPPQIRITNPPANFCTRGDTMRVDGDAVDLETQVPVVTVTPGNVVAPVNDRNFYRTDVAVVEGMGQTVTVVGDNRAGLRGQASRTYNVDRTGPQVSLDLADGAWLAADADGNIIVSGSVVDEGCGLAVIPLFVNGVETLATPEGLFSARQQAVGDLPHITAVATDIVGNQGRVDIDVHIDRLPPTLSNVDPADALATRANTVAVSVTAEDAQSGLGTVTIGGQPALSLGAGRYTRTVNLQPHLNHIEIVAVDRVGLETRHTVDINRDIDAPTVQVVYPTANAAVADKLTVYGTADDGVDGSGLDHVSLNNVDVPVAADGSFVVPNVVLLSGAQTLTLLGVDRAGNSSAPLLLPVNVRDFGVTPAERLGLDGAADIGWIGAADVNADGRTDLIALARTAGGVSRIFTLEANGGYTGHPPTDFGLPETLNGNDAFLADFNADERIDLLVGASGGQTAMYFGDRARGFAAAADPSFAVAGDVTGLAVGDIDRDGQLDILYLAGADTTLRFLTAGGGTTAGTLLDIGDPDLSGMTRATLVDVNTDGLQDLFAVGPAGSRAFLGTAGGAFVSLPNGVTFGDQAATALLPLDADRDRDLDMVVAGDSGIHTLGLSGTDVTSYALAAGGLASAAGDVTLAGGDFDGDLRDDVAIVGAGGLRLYAGGAAGFTQRDAAAAGLPAFADLSAALVVDVDGDADLDLVLGGAGGLALARSNVTTTRAGTYAFVRLAATRSAGGAAPRDAVGVTVYVDYLTAPISARALVHPTSGPLTITYPLNGRANIEVDWIDKIGGLDNYTVQVGNNQRAQGVGSNPLPALPQE